MARNTGWKPSGFDGRDWSWPHRESGQRGIDLRPSSPVRDQAEVPCCVSCAVVTAMEIIGRANERQEPRSPLFNYYKTRRGSDVLDPISIRAALRSAERHGVCPEALYPAGNGPSGPFASPDALARPTGAASRAARKFRLVDVDPDWNTLGYYKLGAGGLASKWRSALSRGVAIVVGFYATEAYQAILRGESTSISDVSVDRGDDGHAVAVIGFDGSWFTVRDSRGASLGDSGHWSVHERVLQRGWAAESWAVAALENS